MKSEMAVYRISRFFIEVKKLLISLYHLFAVVNNQNNWSGKLVQKK